MENKIYEVVLAEEFVDACLTGTKLLKVEEAYDDLILSIMDDGYEEAIKWTRENDIYKITYGIRRKDGREMTEKEETRLRRMLLRFYGK